MDLEKLFKPKSMAVVGISKRNPLSPGRIVLLKNEFEMNVEVFGIYPTGGDIEGIQLYERLDKLPKIPDLLVIAVGPDDTLGYIQDCADLGIPSSVIISGGFAEIGGKGKKRQQILEKIAFENDIAVLGPNCLGVYASPLVDTIFLPTERITRPPKGSVALISQSGGVLVDQFFNKFKERNIGVSTAVSIGNRAVVDETMLLEYFSKVDKETTNIAFYLEGFKEGRARRFLQLAKESEDTVVTFFGGKTREGKVATQSHTASLAGNYKILSAALRQYQIIQANSERELLSSLKVYDVLSHRKNPFGQNVITYGDVVIVSVSGGHGVIASDMLKNYGLNAVRLERQEKKDLRKLMNPATQEIASFNNPIDLTGSVIDTDIEDIVRYLSDVERIECIILLLLPYPPNISFQIGRRIANIVSTKNKPVVCFIPYVPKYTLIIESLELAYISTFHSIKEAVQAVSALKHRTRIDNVKKGNLFWEQKHK
ncbi:MAG: CoA-binding protein [Promethearchaeota archaeon Loki_b31]|nr:MAG: CoA-binding protein [Candidatus Lokiarchaeota archaeon Loki_b31]